MNRSGQFGPLDMHGDGLQSNGGKAEVGIIMHLPTLKVASCWQSAPNYLDAGPGLGLSGGLQGSQPVMISTACARAPDGWSSKHIGLC